MIYWSDSKHFPPNDVFHHSAPRYEGGEDVISMFNIEEDLRNNFCGKVCIVIYIKIMKLLKAYSKKALHSALRTNMMIHTGQTRNPDTFSKVVPIGSKKYYLSVKKK